MKTINEDQEELDPSKTLFFILFTLVLTLLIATYMIIPDIQQLKISKINTSRSLAVLKNTRAHYDKLSEENSILQEDNRKTIESLATVFKEDRLQEFSENILGAFKINQKKLLSFKDDFTKHEMNISSHINSPKLFYNYIDELNKYEGTCEVNFPILVSAKDNYSLDLSFNINVYELMK